MKKLVTLFIALAVAFAVKAQWVNNPSTNTFFSNTSDDAGEVYLATSPDGSIYAQWSQFGPNSWSPSLQRIDADGVPQWGTVGIHPSYHQMASWSQGFAMAATSDNAVVTCFATEGGQTIAIKINADGTYAWGEQGVTVFGNKGDSRTELLAGDDGGVWALGTDLTDGDLLVRYINADGTLNPMITISDDGGKLCMFGLFVPTDNGVFVVYEIEQHAYTYFYEKEIWVAGYNKNGEAISTPAKLMDAQVIGGSYSHYVVPDGLGGGYAYIWHPAIGNAFNVYVFHFDNTGASTIQEPYGVAAHKATSGYYYLDANATVNPTTHELLITFIETDEEFQQLCRLHVNRINTSGYRPWDDGYVVLDNGTTPCTNLLIDAIPYGHGFTLIYNEGSYQSTVKAKGFDMQCNELWSTVMSSQEYPRSMCRNTTGFVNDMNVVAWIDNTNSGSGGLYGQNIGYDGVMGPDINPIPPVDPCYPPTDLAGESYYNPATGAAAAVLSWTAPATQPDHYNLYYNNAKDVIVVDGEDTSYYQELEPNDYIFQLTAVYDDCESDYALTANGDNYVLIELTTSVDENYDEPIVNIVEIYNINGQLLNTTDLENLSQGMYIIKGMTETGKMVVRKVVR